MENKEMIKMNKKGMSNILIFSIIIISLLILGVLFSLNYNKSSKERIPIAAFGFPREVSSAGSISDEQAITSLLFYYKCLTLCPLRSYENAESNNEFKFFDTSCHSACGEKYIMKPGIDSIPAKYEPISEEIGSCIESLAKKQNNEYLSCFQEIFTKYKDEADVSLVSLPEYQKYNFSLTNFSCTTGPNIKFTLIMDEGDENSLIQFLSLDSSYQIIDKLEALSIPQLKEPKKYSLNPNIPKEYSFRDLTYLIVIEHKDKKYIINSFERKC